MTRAERARENFLNGYNCAQSVVLAFSDLFGVNEKTLLQISSPFGGGMGRMREVCGAVSGANFVIGSLFGYDNSASDDEKTRLYEIVQTAMNAFKERNESYICRDLLNIQEEKSHIPSKRTKEYYQERPCANLVYDMAEILESIIQKGNR